MAAIDFSLQTDDYARLRPGFPRSFFDRIERDFISFAGIAAVDLGTGPGFAAHEFVRRGARRAVGVDIAAGQIESARRLASEESLDDRCEFRIGSAESTGLKGDAFDLVFAGQCWGWFDHDAALGEARRLLRPDGWLLVAHYCYLARHCLIARASEDLILEMNPTWNMAGSDGLYPHVVDGIAINEGFTFVEQFCYDEDQPFTHESWRGRMRTCHGVGSGGMSPDDVAEYDRRLADLLKNRFPEEPLLIPHRVHAVVAKRT